MATETVNTIWREEFKDESRIEDSDTTSRDLMENAEQRPLVYKMTWPKGGNSIWSFAKGKRIDSVEEGPELEPYSARNLEEALSMVRTFYMLSTLSTLNENPFRFGNAFIYNATGVINGYIFKPKSSIPDTISPEVVAVSEANGWTDELETAIELAKTTYTSLKKIELLLEKDPEIPDRETIRFIFTVSGDPEQILEEERKFKKCIRNTIRQHTRENITITYYWK